MRILSKFTFRWFSLFFIILLIIISVIIYFTTGATGSGVIYSDLFRGFNSETVGTLTLLVLVGVAIHFVVNDGKTKK